MRDHLAGKPCSFLRSVDDGARLVLECVRELCSARGGIGVFISHDAIVMPVIAWATGERFDGSWLEPLDGIVIEGMKGGALRVIWRGNGFEVGI